MPEANSTSAKSDSSQDGGVKETIESILVAFILAFIFRAFVVEAFVIPTGSMGPTLMGAHLRLTCPDCGYQFAVNFSVPGSNEDTDIPATYNFTNGGSAVCPNCGYLVSLSRASPMPVYFGDRILVLKYRYLFSEPEPWDVVVFKSPYEKHRDENDPKYTDNYIKRLIGRPHTAIMVLDGDVYTADEHELDLTKFKIRRKPAYAQDALWRVVNENDYLPHLKPRGEAQEHDWKQPWTKDGGSGWTGPRDSAEAVYSPDARIFRFDNASGSGGFRFDAEANPDTHALTDWLAYDQTATRAIFNSVSDLRLSCVYHRAAGDGAFRMQLSKREDQFTAEFTRGKVALIRGKVGAAAGSTDGTAWRIERDAAELDGANPVRLELTNVDYRVSVRINGREILATDDQQYHPDVPQLLREYHLREASEYKPTVRIEASRQRCAIEHLSLWRDIYYINLGNHLDAAGGATHEPFWASPDNVVRLGDDEYFVMGDNSEVSLDARYWGAPVNLPREGNYHVAPGRVPGRFMLGKAFFVYWPAGYRPATLSWGVEPDFGDMRFIH